MKYKYFKNGEIVDIDFELDSNYNIGTSWSDYIDGKFVPLSQEQLLFLQNNPSASLKEVFDMALVTTEITLEEVRSNAVMQLTAYDSSSEVNSFLVNGTSQWLSPEVRGNYNTSIISAALLGESAITFKIGSIAVSLNISDAKIMLAKIQRYADACYLVTETHKANINAFATKEEVAAYNFRTGYPDKLVFTV